MATQVLPPSQSKLTIIFLILLTCILGGRLIYTYLADPLRFPINTIKVTAQYKHITHSILENVIARYREHSFFTLPVQQIYEELQALPWTAQVEIQREWPDLIHIVLKEKEMIATWNGDILTNTGDVVKDKTALLNATQLPHLFGPNPHADEVYATYKEMNQSLAKHNLKIATLIQRDNHAWEATLNNGITLKLGKQVPLERITRFSKAYPQLLEHGSQIATVDLRYPRGMAIKWQPIEKPKTM